VLRSPIRPNNSKIGAILVGRVACLPFVNIAREMWTLFEPVHAVTYFTPESRAAFESVGLRGFWRGYFAGRAAPLGAIGPAPVVAAFFGFTPQMVTRAIPDVWQRASPEDVLAARLDGARAALARLAADQSDDAVVEVAELLTVAAGRIGYAGRVLGAANAALPIPEDALGRLWQATTTLREHRGDGHVAALVATGLDGCEVLVWRAANDLDRSNLQPARGWSDEDWQAATGRLVERGWLDGSGAPTPVGRTAFEAVEEATDRTAVDVWSTVDTNRVRDLLKPIAIACRASLPEINPIGLPAL
jgi:hypothetical protein